MEPQEQKLQFIPPNLLHMLVHTPISDDKKANFQSSFGVPTPTSGNLPYQSVVSVLHGGNASAQSQNHYFVVVFMPERWATYLLGKDYMKDSCWIEVPFRLWYFNVVN